MKTKRKYKYYLMLPKDSKSPTESVYKRFDIEYQESVIDIYTNAPNKVYSMAPFTLKWTTKNKLVIAAAKKYVTT